MTSSVLSHVERLAWHRLAQSENVGPVTFRQLLARFGSATEALAAIPALSQRGGLKRPLRLYDASRAEDDLAKADTAFAAVIASCEPEYPELLRQSPSAPPLIFVRGDSTLLARPMLAIVGARNASAIGLRFTRTIAIALAEAGFVIASGLARGIDTAAHEASLGFGTIAVVAGGIDHFYPPENEKLQRAIAERGVLLSEMPMGRTPKPEHFPRRNRIIAGLAKGTVIIEAAMRSGSLSTARFANEAGREVFAVPGSPLDPRCEGTNGLIKDGAHMLTSPSDVLDVINGMQIFRPPLFAEEPSTITFEAPETLRSRVLGLLSPTPVEMDDMVREAHAPAEQVLGILMELELAGQLLRLSGGKIALMP